MTFTVFAPALSGGFVFDDHLLVGGSSPLRGPLHRFWLTSDTPDYWPLTYTLFWLENRAWGSAPAGFHVVSIALHAATALLCWRVLARLRVAGAWVAGALFAIHPVAVESVAWISEQKNVLSGVLFTASILAFLRCRTDGRRFYWISLLLFLGALLAKASTVMLPVALLWILLFRDGAVTRKDALRMAPFFALSILFGLVTVWFQWFRAMSGTTTGRGFLERVGGTGWALASYLEMAFLPVRAAFVYPPWTVLPSSLLFYVPTALLLVLFGALVALRRGPARPVLFALGYHALMLLPVLGLVDFAYLVYTPVSNHLQYLALMGPMALVAAGLARAAERRWHLPAQVATVVLLLAFGAGAAWRATAFQDDLTLWTRAERDAPQSLVAARMRAETLIESGRGDDAIRALVAVSGRLEDPAESHRARALVLLQHRQIDEAIREAAAARALRADLAFDFTVGDMTRRLGHPAKALEILAHVAAREPRCVVCRISLADALVRSGRVLEAAAEFRAACLGDPRSRAACSRFAQLYRLMGRDGEARRDVASALGVPPGSPQVDEVLNPMAP
jgi:tetratricopeptide (TPR) repeat protein